MSLKCFSFSFLILFAHLNWTVITFVKTPLHFASSINNSVHFFFFLVSIVLQCNFYRCFYFIFFIIIIFIFFTKCIMAQRCKEIILISYKNDYTVKIPNYILPSPFLEPSLLPTPISPPWYEILYNSSSLPIVFLWYRQDRKT